MSEPKFGDHVEGVYASAGNPQKFGTFVEVIRRAGRMNPGTFYRLTNEHGDFWEYPAGSCAILDRRSPSAAGRSAEVYEIVVEIKRLALQRSHGGITNSAMLKTLHALCDSAIDIIREEAARD